MFPGPDPALDPTDGEPRDRRPLELHVEHDGTGSASFDWAHILETITRGLECNLRDTLNDPVDVIGIRFIDADGRAVTGPSPAGVTLVGFTTHD